MIFHGTLCIPPEGFCICILFAKSSIFVRKALCSKTKAGAFDSHLREIASQNASKFTYSIINPSVRLASEYLRKELGTDEVAIMTAARYWEHEYFNGNNWLLFDFTKDWLTGPESQYKEDDLWVRRCITSKSIAIADNGETASGFTDVYVAREDDLGHTGSYENADLETPYEGVPYYRFSDVYQDENGHHWFVINNAGYNHDGFGDKGFYSELISFDGLKVSDDKGTITNLPTRDQATRAAVPNVVL